MNDQMKKMSKSVKKINPIAAGIAGAVAGGVAVAAAMVMSDKKNRTKVKNALEDSKEKIASYIDTAKSQPMLKRGVKKLHQVVRDAKKKLTDS